MGKKKSSARGQKDSVGGPSTALTQKVGPAAKSKRVMGEVTLPTRNREGTRRGTPPPTSRPELARLLRLPSLSSSETSECSSNASTAELTQRAWNSMAHIYDQEEHHHVYAQDTLKWTRPKPGDKVLDLGCGTGIFSVLASNAVGPSGIVVGVDFSTEMLNQLRQKKAAAGQRHKNLLVHEHDVGDLGSSSLVQAIADRTAGFDIITCVSSLHLFSRKIDRRAVIRSWAALLKPGGRIMVHDRSAEDCVTTLFQDLGRALVSQADKSIFNRPLSLSVLENMMEDAGLEVTKAWRTESYDEDPQEFYSDDADFVLENMLQNSCGWDVARFKAYYGDRQVRMAWKKIWHQALSECEDETLIDGLFRSIVIATKPLDNEKIETGPGRAGQSSTAGRSLGVGNASTRDLGQSSMRES